MDIHGLPNKPGKNASQKTVTAYLLELQRYHAALQDWDQRLQTWEDDLADGVGSVEEAEDDDEECGCSPEDAMAGCDCPPCEEWRLANPNNPGATGARRKQKAGVTSTASEMYFGPFGRAHKIEVQPSGDEIKFLDDLYCLKDKRRKPRNTKTLA